MEVKRNGWIFFYQYTILINLTPCLCNQNESIGKENCVYFSEFQWNSLFLSKNVFYRWELWIWDTLRKLFCIFFVLDYYFSFSYVSGYGKLTVSCCLCNSHYDKTYMLRNDTRWWCNFNAKDPLYHRNVQWSSSSSQKHNLWIDFSLVPYISLWIS